MILTTTMAKNMEKIIKSGNYDSAKMLYDIDAALLRKRITAEEAEYLRGLVEADLEARVEEQLRQLGK
ncbi:MAG: hypothetical protein ACRC18_06330 [Cetobacterium sp.]